MELPSQSHFVRQGRVAAPSVCFAAARILLAAAPTAPPCFRHWRRSSPLPPKGEPLADRATSYWTPEARYGAKGRALLQRAGLPLYNLSVIADAMPPLLVGEALAIPAK